MKISQGSQGPHLGNLRCLGSRRECCWGYVSTFENTPKKWLHLSPKSCRNFTQWFRERCSWSIEVTQLRLVLRLHASNSNPDVYYIEGNDHTGRPIWNYATGTPNILESVLNQIMPSNSTVGKCTPMEVTKQPEQGRTSTTKEQK